MDKIYLTDLVCQDDSINLDEYLIFSKMVRDNMEHPDWLGVFSEDDLKQMLKDNSKIWNYYLNDEIVCSMMYIPATEHSAMKLEISNYDFRLIADYGPMMVNPKYIGNGLQYQMLKVLNQYALNIGCKYAVATIHPDNIYSINNFLKDEFLKIGQKDFKRGRRDIYFKQLNCN